MRKLVRVLATVLFATIVTSCGVRKSPEPDTDPGSDEDSDTGGAGAGESWDTPPEEGEGSGSGSGSGSGEGEGSGSGSGSSSDGGSEPPPPPPVTCDHNHDGACDDHDCDHDNDNDCDGDDGGDGHHEGACTFTQGFWKNHPDAWPVSSLLLGQRSYSSTQLVEILKTPVATDGLMILAHQLIAAKLNIAFGAPSSSIANAIAAADALIGNLIVGVDTLPSSQTSDLATELDRFNNSKLADEECD